MNRNRPTAVLAALDIEAAALASNLPRSDASRLPDARSGTHSRLCSSFPKYQIGSVPSEWCAATVIATDESTRVSSSTAIA